MEQLTTCPICRTGNPKEALHVKDHFLSKEDFRLDECQACGFRFTNPRPAQNVIAKYYQSEDYISHSNRKQGLQDRLYQMARTWALGNKYKLVHRFQSQGRVLDIGCGTGEFLAHLMSRGYLVEGVEPELKAREQAIANHSIAVLPSVEQIPNKEYYQVITLWHVLEHVPDVRATLKNLYALLADRGILVIAVPDRESWDNQHYGAHWAAWDVPRHLSHFRRQDVHRLLNEHGFQLLATNKMWLDAFYIAMLSERYKGAGALSALIKGIFIGAWSNLQCALGNRPTSSSLFVARKVEP
jgi:2-polyprenyl-3-methyl-5-hydroxy-6-metoxy-1,4-benzoquinol methylase